jgi:DNA-binding CsgD family transcriptional regulator
MHEQALNALAVGIAICDGEGRIVFANQAAREFASQRNGIVIGQASLRLAGLDGEDAQSLALMIDRAARRGAGGSIRLKAENGGDGLLVGVTALPPSLRSDYGADYALIVMQAVGADASFTKATLAAMFDLSPTQAAIAIAIFNGRSPEEIAAARGVRISTLRTHLAEIFARTGTETQRDLIRLLAMLPPLR